MSETILFLCRVLVANTLSIYIGVYVKCFCWYQFWILTFPLYDAYVFLIIVIIVNIVLLNDLIKPTVFQIYIAAFAVSSYASSCYRVGHKPFNPLLGETYENVREDKGWKFVSEQVGLACWWQWRTQQLVKLFKYRIPLGKCLGKHFTTKIIAARFWLSFTVRFM